MLDCEEAKGSIVRIRLKTMNASMNARPRLLLAYADSDHAVRCGRQFRRRGWEVHLASTAAEASRLVERVEPDLIVLDTELPDESGWLLCAKLGLDAPKKMIVLVGPRVTPELERRGKFVGAAALVTRNVNLTTLLRGASAAQVA